jgi:hypothetical protein
MLTSCGYERAMEPKQDASRSRAFTRTDWSCGLSMGATVLGHWHEPIYVFSHAQSRPVVGTPSPYHVSRPEVMDSGAVPERMAQSPQSDQTGQKPHNPSL